VYGIRFFQLTQVMGSNNGVIDFQRQNIELCRYGSTTGNRQWDIAQPPVAAAQKCFQNFNFNGKPLAAASQVDMGLSAWGRRLPD